MAQWQWADLPWAITLIASLQRTAQLKTGLGCSFLQTSGRTVLCAEKEQHCKKVSTSDIEFHALYPLYFKCCPLQFTPRRMIIWARLPTLPYTSGWRPRSTFLRTAQPMGHTVDMWLTTEPLQTSWLKNLHLLPPEDPPHTLRQSARKHAAREGRNSVFSENIYGHVKIVT